MKTKRHQRRAAVLFVGIHPRLKDLVEKAADKADLYVNEYVADLLARELGCDDLRKVPRDGLGGRPRTKELIPA